MKLLAFAASSSRNSINKQLLTYAINLLKKQVNSPLEIHTLNLTEFDLPLYSIDKENASGIPAKAQYFFDAIGQADGLLISYAEHNGLYTAIYKNLFDWASRIDMKVYQGKPVVQMAASVGPNGGKNVLRIAREAAPHFGAEVIGEFLLNSFTDNFDPVSGQLTDPVLNAKLLNTLNIFTTKDFR